MVVLRNACVVSLAAIAAAAPASYGGSACASVSAAVASQASASPSSTPTVPAQLAYECITSVPLNKTAALKLMNSVKPYVKWQTTVSYLKNPPPEYVQKIQNPVDVWAGIAQIEANINNGVFKNEWDFGWAFYSLLQSTHDGHFVYIPDVVGTVFNWARPVPLVSVSADGTQLPKAYVYSDILTTSVGKCSFTPSPIVKIDGESATTWLENWSQHGSLQDRDALYNNVFYELAQVSLGTSGSGMGTFTGGGRGRWVYPGATTTLTFANGTSKTYNNFAKVLIPFDGVDSGEALYKLWFSTPSDTSFYNGIPIPSASASASASTSAAATPAVATSTPAPGYPPPVIREMSNLIGGYFIDEPGYDDIAVLSVPSFVGTDQDEIPFQQTGQQFIAAAKAAGKTKLIIDLSANGGGTILQGYDLFKQLFPQVDPYSAADRHRAFESTYLIGEKFSALSAGLPRTLDWGDNETLEDLEENVISSNFNYRTDMTTDEKPFPSWNAKFGPHPIHGDFFSTLFRWNLSDTLTPLNSGGIYVTGYGNRTNFTQPFAAENIVVVTDGYCASTCTIFSELMRQLVGVKYISLGGRARPGITQAIGGVKGTNDLPWDYIQFLVAEVYNYSSEKEQAAYNKTELAEYDDQLPFLRAARNTAHNINFRDGIRKTDPTQTPLQFQYEASDCRILYTPEMTVDVTAVWKAAADSTWGERNACIAGSVESHSKLKRRISADTTSVPSLHGRSAEDYPFDLYTDLKNVKMGDGWMMP